MFSKTVNFALILYDDFTGKPITLGGQLFHINDRLVRPIAKPEGFYVFAGLQGDVFDVVITGGKYMEEKIRVDITTLKKSNPVVPVYMYRRYQAGFSDCDFVQGALAPRAMVYALKQSKAPMKLVAINKVNEDTAVMMSGYFYKPVEQLNFFLGTQEKGEIFRTQEILPDKSYLLTDGLAKKHKSGEAITRLYATRCDEDGNYYIPVDIGEKSFIKTVIFYEKEEEKWGCSSAMELS